MRHDHAIAGRQQGDVHEPVGLFTQLGQKRPGGSAVFLLLTLLAGLDLLLDAA